MPLVLTDDGVAECPEINRDQLDALAQWLCEHNNYHDRLQGWAAGQVADEEFERQHRDNGGYCNLCRDFAGKILAQFTLIERTDQ